MSKPRCGIKQYGQQDCINIVAIVSSAVRVCGGALVERVSSAQLRLCPPTKALGFR